MKMTETFGFHVVPNTKHMLDSTHSDADFMNTIITGDESWVYGYDLEPVIFLTMKIRESTKHYLTQILLAINGPYSQAGKIHVCV